MIVRLWRALPEDHWPEADRNAFERASAGWRSSSQITRARMGYGQLLAFCAKERCAVDRPSVERFHAAVRMHLRPIAANSMLRGLANALLALRPEDGEGWAWLLEANRVHARQIKLAGQKAPHQKAPHRSRPRLSVPPEEWPEVYRLRWAAALTPLVSVHHADRYGAEALRAAKEERGQWRLARHPSKWRPATVANVEQGWGMWLWWTANQEPGADPDEITPERMARYIDWHARRTRQTKNGMKQCSPMTLLRLAGELHAAARILQPGTDWSWLGQDIKALAQVAVPVRDKLAKLVPLKVLYLLGEALANKAARRPPSMRAAVEERDGVLVAMLTLLPKRIGDFGEIRIGANLSLDEHGDPIALKFGRTKNGGPSNTPIPKRLKPLLRRYLDGSRRLLNAHGSDRLWLNERGNPLTTSGIAKALAKRTLEEKTIRTAINAHAFRSIYATSIGSFDPDALPAGSWMLDHRDERTVIDHYSPISETAYASGTLDARTSALAIHPPRRKIRRRGPKKRSTQGRGIPVAATDSYAEVGA